MQSGEAAGLLLGVRLAIHIGTVARSLRVCGQPCARGRIKRSRPRHHRFHQRVLGCHHHVGGAEQRVGPRGEHAQRTETIHREVDLRALAATDPLGLLHARALGPVDQLQVIEQAIGVRRDAEHPLAQRQALHRMAAALAATVDHFLVGQHRAQLGAPVHGLLAQVGQSTRVEPLLPLLRRARAPRTLRAIHRHLRVARNHVALQLGDRSRLARLRVVPAVVGLQPDPLRPLHVARIDGAELAAPVVAEAEALQLPAKVVDGLGGGHLRMHARLHRVLLGGQAEGVPSHRMQHVAAAHALEARDDVGGRVALGVPHMQTRAAWVREHVQHVVLGARGVEARIARVAHAIGAIALPARLPGELDAISQRRVVAEWSLVGHAGRSLPPQARTTSGLVESCCR